MTSKHKLAFGYNPPTGDRGFETIRPATFVADLHRVLDVATTGFESIWLADHLQFGMKYRLECWTQLAWIAARYPDMELGTIVLANSFRQPALMAKMAASLQVLSTGRFVLGYGAGWHEEEYVAYGYDYPSPGIRLAMLEEGIQVIRALWTEAPANFEGKFYRLADAYCEPRPDPLPPLMIGGSGEKRTLRLVARYADWWNATARPLPDLEHKLGVLRTHCEAEGRDFDGLRKTIMVRVYIDRVHANAIRQAGDQLQSDNPPVAGDPVAVREQLLALNALGFDLCQLVFTHFPETDDMQLFIDEVLPAFR